MATSRVIDSSRDPLSSHRADWTLPSSRLEYVKNHPVTTLAELHSNEKMIAPVWSKVSKTAWYDRAQLCSGYGTRQQITKISVDCPGTFFDAHRTAAKFPRPRMETHTGVNESSYVLPAGQSILAATLKSKQDMRESGNRKTYKIYSDGKRGLLKNIEAPTPRPPVHTRTNNEFSMAAKDSGVLQKDPATTSRPHTHHSSAMANTGKRVVG